MEGFGKIFGSFERLWEALGSFDVNMVCPLRGLGRLWKALQTLQGFVRLWVVLRDFERLWEALGCLVRF